MRRVLEAISCGLVAAVILAILSPQPAVASNCGYNRSHNSFLGRRVWNDQLLYSTYVRVESSWFKTVTTDVYFPNRASQKGNISYIELLDQKADGSGGCGYIRTGGPGYNYTSIHLKSSGWREGIDFIVKIFGVPSRWR